MYVISTGDKFDNRLSNLKYMTRSEHRKFDGSQLPPNCKKLPHNINPDLSYRDAPDYWKRSAGFNHELEYVDDNE